MYKRIIVDHALYSCDFNARQLTADVVEYEKLVRGAIHRSDNLLNRVLTDVRRVINVKSIGSPDHCSLACNIQLGFSYTRFYSN